VTSGGFGVSLDAPIAMGYLPVDATAPRTRVFAEVRGRRLPVLVCELPIVTPRYKRQ
jgi:aminomethyltransferase